MASGYLNASLQTFIQVTPKASAAEVSSESIGEIKSKEVTILYESQTGNAQRLAKTAGKTLEANGYRVTVSSRKQTGVRKKR